MRSVLRSVFVGLCALTMSSIVACGSSSYNCSQTSCGQAPTASDVSQCQAAESGACSSQFEDAANCAASNCSNTNSACQSQLAAVFACCSANPTTGGCSSLTGTGTDAGM